MTCNGRPARHRWVVAATVTLTMTASACGGADPPEPGTTTAPPTPPPTTTVPERPGSTTTTAFDPASVEGAVEGAYLRSWDVYADAVYDLELDEALFAEVYAGEHLETKLEEVRGRIREGRAALVRVEHDYSIQLLDAHMAVVLDHFRNHQVLIDPVTKRPIEADPDEALIDVTTLVRDQTGWKVRRKERVR